MSRRRCLGRLLSATAAWCAVCWTSSAAPPEVEWLLPAGAQRGETATVTVGGKLGTAPVACWSSRRGVEVTVPETPEKSATVRVAADAEPGLAWLRFYNAEGASPLRPFVVGVVPEAVESEDNDRVDEAQAIELPATINGAFAKRGDVDVYSVELQQQQTLVAALDANSVLGSPLDGVLQLLSPAGNVLEQNDDDQGFDPRLVFTAPGDGRYFVRAFCFPATPNSSIRLDGDDKYVYRLTLTTGPFVDHSLPLAVTAGSAQQVRLRGWNLPAELQQLEVTPEPGETSFEVRHPQLHNTAPGVVVTHPTTVERELADGEPPQILDVPSTVSGCLEQPRETDRYRVASTKGQRLRIAVAARSLGSLLDPVVRVSDSAGKRLAENDDASRESLDSELTVTAPDDGELQLEITDRFTAGGFRYAYALTVENNEPGFNLTVSTDRFKLVPGKPLEITVAVDRDRGFSDEVEVTASGLPEHVTAAPVVSQSKGDSSKSVKLVLTSEASEPFQGPLRITGQALGERRTRRAASATVTETMRTIDHWLTIAPGK